MRPEIRAGDWECFAGVKDMNETKKSPIILCRPQYEKETGPYLIFHKNRVIIHKPEKLDIIDTGYVKVMVKHD